MLTKKTTFLAIACAAISFVCLSDNVHADDTPVVALFDALDSGQVNVKFIPANSVTANVLIENQTDQVLHIELPDAIAAVPILAQFGQQQPGQAGDGGGGGNQSVGGGLNPGGNGGRQGGAQGGIQGGFLRVAAQKTRKLKATTVCMEYGKLDPNPRVAYKMIPIIDLTTDEKVIDLCTQLGQKQVDQKVAQAVAWHLANGLDWQRIAKINRLQSRYLGNVPMFTSSQVRKAKELLETLGREANDANDDDTNRYASQD